VKAPDWTRLRWLPTAARAALYAELALAVACFVFLGFHLFGDVFAGSPPALPVQVAATCESTEPASSCHASVMELYRGRYRVTTDVPTARLTLTLEPQGSAQRAKDLLIRLSQPAAARLESRSTNTAAPNVVAASVSGSGFRAVLPLPPSAVPLASLAFVAESGADPQPFVLDEVGLFENDHGLLNDVRPLFAWVPSSRFYGTLVPRALSRLFVLCVIGSFVVSRPILRKLNPWILGLVCFGCCLLDLAILFSPYGTHDLRLFYASGTLQEVPGANLNVALWQGFRFLQGEGLTYSNHAVPWSRMPGYGLFCAVAGALFGHRTMLDLAIGTVLLQVLFYCVALMCLAWAAGRLWPPQAVLTVGLLIAFLPKELAYTQVDAIIAPIAMLVTAALCLRISASRHDQGVRPGLDVLVHSTFALWFVMRPDVLPGWIAVSLALHWRNWQRLLIPAMLFLVIGFSWGVYRSRYTNEFTMTTSSAGASLFCGLWEVPSRFAPTCSDQSYFTWIAEHTSFNPLSTPANNFTVREVLRFWLTYPGHFVAMIDHKMMLCVDGGCWPGLRTFLHEALFYLLVWPPRAIVGLLTIIGLCVAVDHERRRTLLFGWPLLFNAPLFWVMFASEGRFYAAIPIALLTAAVPPLFEGRFYARLAARPWRTVSVLACAAVLAVAAWPFHDWLLRADAFRYWTPFLDPAQSQLSGFK
jgi:hypothetical protein